MPVLGYAGFSDILTDLVEDVTNILGRLPASLEVLDDVLARIAGVLDGLPGLSVGAGGSEAVRVNTVMLRSASWEKTAEHLAAGSRTLLTVSETTLQMEQLSKLQSEGKRDC